MEETKFMLDNHMACVEIRKMLGENFMPSVKYTITLGWSGLLQRFKVNSNVANDKIKKFTKVVSLVAV